MKKIMAWVMAATLICGSSMMVTSCDNSDNPITVKKKTD